MRPSTKLVVAFLFLTANAGAFAQYKDVDPRTLPAQIAAQETIVQAEPGSKDWHAWLKLAVLLQDAGNFRDSEDAYHHTITLLRAPDPFTVADVFDHMATMYVASGQFSEAEPVERHALAIREHQHDTLGVGISHMHLAMLLLGENDLHSAETEAQTAVNLLVPEYAHLAGVSLATPEEKMTALIDLALVQSASGESSSSIPNLRSALLIAQKNYPDNSFPVGYIDFLLGSAYWQSGNLHDADDLMSQGVHKLAAEIGWGHPTYLKTLRQYRAFLVQTSQRDKAQQVLAEINRLDHSGDSLAIASREFAAPQSLPR